MNVPWSEVLISLCAGAVLGLIYFWGLWLTVNMARRARHPMLLVFGSFIVRASVLVLVLVALIRGRLLRGLVALAGVFIVREIMVRFLRPNIAEAEHTGSATSPFTSNECSRESINGE